MYSEGAMSRGFSALRAWVVAFCAPVVLVPIASAAAGKADRELEARLRVQVETLASDEFEGREPGTEGEARTLRYLGREWFKIGLVSGTNDPGNEWFAPVTLVAREPAASSARFVRKGRRVWPRQDSVLVLTSGKRSLIPDAPLLFVGNGESSESSRSQLAGRIAVLLDTGAASGETQNRLLAEGASAVMTVLDGERTIEQISARRKRSGYALAQDTLGGDLEAFITRDAMADLLKGTGVTMPQLEKLAEKRDFSPIPLDITATFEATTRETTIRTHNLIGKLPGRRSDAGAVLFMAHWDAFGRCAVPPAEDEICNGAIDNASGVAVLTEVARNLVKGPKQDRDIYFLATTAEELGLLGAHAFAENPPIPTEQFVAAFNIDSVAIAPRGTPVAIVGRGMTGLDKQIEQVARREGMKVVPNDEANEYVRRQDGWALIQHDIPTVMVTTAYGKIEKMRAFYDGDYHRPSDDVSHLIEYGGAADDVRILTALGRWFGDARHQQSPVVASQPTTP